MLCGVGDTIDEDPPVRSVISDGAAMVDALIAGGLEQRGGRPLQSGREVADSTDSAPPGPLVQTSCASRGGRRAEAEEEEERWPWSFRGGECAGWAVRGVGFRINWFRLVSRASRRVRNSRRRGTLLDLFLKKTVDSVVPLRPTFNLL
jgi:hypothetical protein